MNVIFFKKIIFSIITIICVSLISHFTKKKAKEISDKRNIIKSRYFAIKRFISCITYLVLIIILTLIWGVSIKDLWVSLVGIIAMVAVAFFAVWSLIGNILAGFLIYFTSPFKINDYIEILPDGIKGKVLAINTFYSVVSDEEENYINIPNSLFFQKYIKKTRKEKKSKQEKLN